MTTEITGRLHYTGDRRQALADNPNPMGPGRGGMYYVVEAAEYDPATDTTTAHMSEADQ